MRRFALASSVALLSAACADTLSIPEQRCSDAGYAELPVVTDAGALPRFSFFVTSQRALVALSGCTQGFGGDLRYGHAGAGAGLRGPTRSAGSSPSARCRGRVRSAGGPS